MLGTSDFMDDATVMLLSTLSSWEVPNVAVGLQAGHERGWPASSQAVMLHRWPETCDVAKATVRWSTQGPSVLLHKQSAVMTSQAATMLWLGGGCA